MGFETISTRRQDNLKGIIYRLNGKDRKHATIYFSEYWIKNNNVREEKRVAFLFDKKAKLAGFRFTDDVSKHSFKFQAGKHGGAEVKALTAARVLNSLGYERGVEILPIYSLDLDLWILPKNTDEKIDTQ